MIIQIPEEAWQIGVWILLITEIIVNICWVSDIVLIDLHIFSHLGWAMRHSLLFASEILQSFQIFWIFKNVKVFVVVGWMFPSLHKMWKIVSCSWRDLGVNTPIHAYAHSIASVQIVQQISRIVIICLVFWPQTQKSRN